MKNKKGILLKTFLGIAIILSIVIVVLLYIQKKKEDKKIAELEETIDFMIISDIRENVADDWSHRYKLVTDKTEIVNIINIINTATKYETDIITGFLSRPTIEIYYENGERYHIGVWYEENGNSIILKYKNWDQSDKELCKVDGNLTEHLKKLYNTIGTSSLTSNKEIYIANSTPYAGEDFPEFIVLENNRIYLSTNLSNKILEGTYTVNSNNEIEYKILNEDQDYEFYTSATLKFEEIEGEKVIEIENNKLNTGAYYQKVY